MPLPKLRWCYLVCRAVAKALWPSFKFEACLRSSTSLAEVETVAMGRRMIRLHYVRTEGQTVKWLEEEGKKRQEEGFFKVEKFSHCSFPSFHG